MTRIRSYINWKINELCPGRTLDDQVPSRYQARVAPKKGPLNSSESNPLPGVKW